MRKFETSSFGWVAFFIFFIFFTTALTNRVSAQGEDVSTTTTDKSEPVAEETSSVGIGKFFKLPFHVTVSVRGGYDDNVLSGPGGAGSAFVEGSLGIIYSFGNPRTQLSVQSQIGFTDYFEEMPNFQFDFHPNLSLSASHKVSPRLTLALTTYLTYQQQPDFTNNFIGLDRRSGSYFFTTDKLSASLVWTPRFSTVSSFTFVGLQ